jgi:predicted lysophospholipase L1 biosynthesis ABC-type transport system permease subunit
MAEEFWPGQDPIGKRFLREGRSPRTVVGVVADVKNSGLDRVPRFQAYVPYSQRPLAWFMFAIRTEADPAAMAGTVREAVRSVDVEQPITNLETMSERLSGSVSRQRFLLLLLATFGVTALVLTAAGVFGMVSYIINTRLHEMGIRAAMGATQKSLFWLVVLRYMRPVVLGIIIGIVFSQLLASYLRSQLYQTSPNDPLVYVLTVGGLCAVALLALLLPARRAATADPALLLRSQ